MVVNFVKRKIQNASDIQLFKFNHFFHALHIICLTHKKNNKKKFFLLIETLTVILAWISNNFPPFPTNLQVNSSTDAFKIRKRSWFLVNIFSNVFISNFNVFRHAITAKQKLNSFDTHSIHQPLRDRTFTDYIFLYTV